MSDDDVRAAAACQAMLREANKWIRNVDKNFDCDRDGHRYNTYCRKCEAKALANQIDALLVSQPATPAEPSVEELAKWLFLTRERFTWPPCPDAAWVEANSDIDRDEWLAVARALLAKYTMTPKPE